MSIHARLNSLMPSTLLVVAGCAGAHGTLNHGGQTAMLELLMPSRIEIVEPFTGVKSFDQDATPDGIELLLQAVNSLDNPGLMIAGHVRVELYEFVGGSADHKGRKLDQWDVDLVTADDQRRHWNQVTQMYEFRLAANPATIPPVERFVLAVSFRSPLGQQLSDESTLDYGPNSHPAAGFRPLGLSRDRKGAK